MTGWTHWKRTLLSGSVLFPLLICSLCVPSAIGSDFSVSIAINQTTGVLTVTTSLHGTCEKNTKSLQLKTTEGKQVAGMWIFNLCKVQTICLDEKTIGKTLFLEDILKAVKSNEVIFNPLQVIRNDSPQLTTWSQKDMTSTMRVMVSPFISTVSVTLTVQESTEPSSSNICDKENKTTIEGVYHKKYHTFIFTVDWNKLNNECVYKPMIIQKNACGDHLTKVYGPLLEYEEQTKQDKTGDGGKPTQTEEILIVVFVLIALFLILLAVLFHRQKLRRGSILQHAPRDRIPLLKKRSVLMLYARDVGDPVAGLMVRLRESKKYEVLDLYDERDSEKLKDATAWLQGKLHDPSTHLLVVASPMAKKYSIDSASSPLLGIRKTGEEEEVDNREKSEEEIKMLPKSDCSEKGKDKNEGEEKKEDAEEDVEERPLDFLLKDALKTLENTKLSHDYAHVYQIRFEDSPRNVVLNNVTPERIYVIPQHEKILLDHLSSTSSFQPSNDSQEIGTFLEIMQTAEEV